MSKSINMAEHLQSQRYKLAEARFWRAVSESMKAVKRAYASDKYGDDPTAFAEFLGWQIYGRAAIDHMHAPRCHRK